jgi:EmrB/QacA subfamily drug resistance transporter
VSDDGLRLSTTAGKGALLAATVASGIGFLEISVVSLALPHIGADFGASVSGLSGTLSAYTLTLTAFVLLGGAVGDRYGRRRVFLLGLGWFTAASVLCGVATGTAFLIGARALQGAGAALLIPGSLAMLQASFHRDERSRVIGLWSGLSGAFTAIGPFAGGWLIDALTWRWIFFLNVPFAALVLLAALRWVPESRNPARARRFDVLGAVLGTLGLGGLTYALIDAADAGLGAPRVLLTGLGGIAVLVAFVLVERWRGDAAMLPLRLFRRPGFGALNAYTVVVYASLSAQVFLFAIYLQNGLGYSALAAGAASVPSTIIMLLFSGRAGALGARVGPRLPLVVGPLLGAAGSLLLRGVGPGDGYWLHVLPGVLVFGVGLTLLVAPLTAAVLSSVQDRYAGTASGINNAAARAGGLVATAALPLAVGLSGEDYQDPAALGDGFRAAMVGSAGLLVLGALVAAKFVRTGRSRRDGRRAAPARRPATAGRSR